MSGNDVYYVDSYDQYRATIMVGPESLCYLSAMASDL